MANQISYSDADLSLAKHFNNALPLALLISIMVAVYSSVDAYFCGCSLLEILWVYSRNGLITCLSIATLFFALRR